MDLIQLPCELSSFKTYSTKQSVMLNFETQEALDPIALSKVLQHKGRTGWMLFSPTRLSIDQIPNEPVDESRKKSQSQRLRAVLYRLWESKGSLGNFETYYINQTEKIIEQIKEKI